MPMCRNLRLEASDLRGLARLAVEATAGVTGLVGSYYTNTATGAAIVLVAIGCFFVTLAIKALRGARA